MNTFNVFSALSTMLTVGSVMLVLLVLLFGIIRKPAKVHAGLCVTIVSALLAFFSALVFRKFAAAAMWNIIISVLNQSSDGAAFVEMLKDTPNLYSFISGILAALVAPLVFYIAFLINKLFLMLFNALFAKIFAKNAPQNGAKWIVKLGVGLVNGMLILLCLLIPTISMIDISSTVMKNEDLTAVIGKLTETDDFETFAYSMTKLEENPIIKLNSAIGGKKLSDTLTSVKSGDEKIPVSKQLDRTAEAVAAVIDIAADASKGSSAIFTKEFTEKLDKLTNALEKDPSLTAAVADLISVAAKTVKDEGSLGDIELPEDPTAQAFAGGFIGTLEKIDENNLTETLKDLTDVLDNFIDTGAADKLTGEEPDIMGALSTPGVVSGTLEAVKGNEALQPLADAITETAVTAIADKLGVDEETSAALKESTSLDLKNMTDEKAQDVEKMVSSAGKVAGSISDKEGSDVLKDLDTDALKDLLDAIDGAEIIEGGSDKLLDAVIESPAMKDSGFVDEDTLEKLKEGGAESISGSLGSAQKTVSIVEELSSEEPDKGSIKEDIEWLIGNMDETGADFVGDQLTPDKLTTFGVDPVAAPGVAVFVSNLLDEMTAAESDSSIDADKEAAALTNLYSFGVSNAGSVNNGNIFGAGNGKADAGELVNTILSSTITSNALNKTAVVDGKLQNDPLGCSIELSNADKTALVSAINEGLKASLGTTGFDNTKTTVLSIAALFGVEGSIDSNAKFTAK